VNIFHRAEGLLPEFELHGGVELRKASVKVVLKCIRILEVNGVGLVGIFCNIGEVKTQCLAKSSKLNLTLMLETKLERLLCNLL
jgi:hypothetical protein